MKNQTPDYYVYFIYCFRLQIMKIGKTGDIKTRVRAVASGFPYNVSLQYLISTDQIMSRVVEKAFHVHFKHARLNGEWFKLDPIDIESHFSILRQQYPRLVLLTPDKAPIAIPDSVDLSGVSWIET